MDKNYSKRLLWVKIFAVIYNGSIKSTQDIVNETNKIYEELKKVK